jgi:hypothetical protein
MHLVTVDSRQSSRTALGDHSSSDGSPCRAFRSHFPHDPKLVLRRLVCPHIVYTRYLQGD